MAVAQVEMPTLRIGNIRLREEKAVMSWNGDKYLVFKEIGVRPRIFPIRIRADIGDFRFVPETNEYRLNISEAQEKEYAELLRGA